MRYLFASLKVVGPLAFVGAVVAEWAGASAGLGRVMWLAYANMNMPILFAAILCSAVMGICIFLVLTTLEKRTIFW
jgi:ABC-type nitrate/sulfonate/bicarbonate transport system permease component